MSSSSSIPAATPSSSWQKRLGRQKQQTSTTLGSWFVRKFGGGGTKSKNTVREEEVAALHGRRRPVGKLSAVTNQQQANAARREELGPPKPMRQKSFLRHQLEEMKRQSAEMLQLAQKRMNGEIVEEDDEEEKGLTSDEDDEEDEDDNVLCVIHDPEDALRKSVTSNPARSWRSSSSSLRPSVEGDEEAAQANVTVEKKELSEEVNRRLSQATQLYAEAISELDSALHPKKRPQQLRAKSSPQPLLLGATKQERASLPKNEWI
ncbi:hypothetical protein PsorP6_006982 [Peronosclerospora sorghi]|uniref:Uncharacterized protein n=1 Tax=Peronosclerospora sorghi TaxID=230839 RepID=A0ACC0W9Q7_9STRA|nr:hypothetical protein PsorP6_006982 [Peronosclerospora sorghi]